MKKMKAFTGGRRRQGGWLAAALGLAGSLFGASRARKEARRQQELQERAIAAADPYGPYRAAAAEKLNNLTFESVVNTPEYKARQTAAARLMAAQGYTGSGNAVVAAAEAGGASYQQAWENLARMAGVDAQPGGGYNLAASGANSQNYLNNMSGALNSLVYSTGNLLGAFGQSSNMTNTGQSPVGG